MHIVVCVKQTPSSANIPVDLATGKLKSEGLAFDINPLDLYAVEEALRIKERVPGSTISVLSMGPERAEESIRMALALGCDQGFLLSDPKFDGSDSLATAYVLSMGIRKIAKAGAGDVHLVICGKQTSDGESGQVASALAGWLDWPAASSVKKIPGVNSQSVTVERLMEDGVDSVELPFPAVISVVKEINEPRIPSLKGKMASKKAVISRISAADAGVVLDLVGEDSATFKAGASVLPPRPAGAIIEGATNEEKAKNLVQKLKELKLV